MSTFANLAALKKAQQSVADASVALGSAIAEADGKLSRPAAGPGRNAYDALMSMKRTQDSWFITAREFVTTGAIEGVPATPEQVQKLVFAHALGPRDEVWAAFGNPLEVAAEVPVVVTAPPPAPPPPPKTVAPKGARRRG